MTDDVIGLVWRSPLVSFFTVKNISTYMFWSFVAIKFN